MAQDAIGLLPEAIGGSRYRGFDAVQRLARNSVERAGGSNRHRIEAAKVGASGGKLSGSYGARVFRRR